MTAIKNKIGRFIVITFLFAFTVSSLNAQEKAINNENTITGVVVDAVTGLPVNAAEVICEGYASAITNEDGTFSVRTPLVGNEPFSPILRVKAWGYQAKEFPARGKKDVKIRLISDVLPAFYEKGALPYSSNQTNQFYPGRTSLENRLQEEFGEVRTIIRSGAPGIGGNIFLRGFNSMTASSQPLIVVDGIPYEMLETNRFSIFNGSFIDPLSNIDPEDIESATVIKDGYALYSVKGANGVISITTKRTKEQTSKIAASASWGVNMAPRQLPVLNAGDYRTLASEQLGTANLSPLQISDQVYLNDDPTHPNYYTYHNNTNWQDEVFRNGMVQNYHGQVAGGDNIAKYALSLGYTSIESTLNNASMNRFNTRFNTDIDLSKALQLALGVSYSQTDRTLRDDGVVLRSSPSFLSLVKSPLVASHLVSPSGVKLATYADEDFWGLSNPAVLQSDNTMGEGAQYRVGIYGKLNLNLGSDWLLNATVSYDYDKLSEAYFIPDYGVASELLPQIGQTSIRFSQNATSRYIGIYGSLSANYKKTFNYIHRVNVNLGLRYQNNGFEYSGGKGHNSSQERNPYLEKAMIGKVVIGNQDDWKWVSAYLDAAYSLKDRYRLSVSLSEDGTSRAGANQRYALFPSIGTAWDIAAESFMAGLPSLNALQLRATAGITGNDRFSYLASSEYFQATDYLNMKGILLSNLENDKLKWETTTKTNIGLDVAFFNERVALSADFYLNKTNDLITFQPLNHASGFTGAYVNGGNLENRGLELKLGLRIVDTRDFKWNTRFSIAKYKNKITALPGGNDILNEYSGATILSRVGQPLGVFYGYQTLGVFATAEEAHNANLSTYYDDRYRFAFEAGDIHFKDNGDGIIDEKDRRIIGDPNPDFFGSVALNFSYKRFLLDVVFTGVYGNDVYNHLRAQTEGMNGFYNQSNDKISFFNQSTHVLNRWKAEGQVTDVPRADFYDRRGNSRFSDRWIEDGSFLRLKNLTLTWKFPKKLGFLDGFSVFASAENLFVITKYLGGDPEFSSSPYSLYQGIDTGFLSQGRSFMGGVKINL
ncbi:SusC/RagA family TonB-linked outer membrane protein [Bacteroidia bacterium]|nr:SusC/RagA family TonB-linked outer membrane protein [Bacteroidia bacterium]